MKKTAIALALSALALPAVAMDPMPEEGFSGFFGLGVNGGRIESNFLAKVVDIDLSDDTIDSLDSPESKNVALPSVAFNLGYTFSGQKTRIYLANEVESALDLSSAVGLALRHDFDSLGNMEVAALSGGLGTAEVWEDPYISGAKRRSTEVETSGVRIGWDKIFGTNLELKATAREKELDDEFSGDYLNLSAADKKLLDREGDITRVELGYHIPMYEGAHSLRPSVAYIDRDLDGDAMSQDGYEVGLEYVYRHADFTWLNRGLYQQLDGDAVNPIFGGVNDEDTYAFASEVRVAKPFGWEKWAAGMGVQWADGNSDIDFNDSSVWMFNAKLARTF